MLKNIFTIIFMISILSLMLFLNYLIYIYINLSGLIIFLIIFLAMVFEVISVKQTN